MDNVHRWLRFRGLSVSGVLLFSCLCPVGAEEVQTQDGLWLRLTREGFVDQITVSERRVLFNGAQGGLNIRDAQHPETPVEIYGEQILAAPPTFQLSFPSLLLKATLRYTPLPSHILVDAEIEDTSGTARALDVLYELPVGQPGWTWWEGLRQPVRLEATADIEMLGSPSPVGSTGKSTLYPYCALSSPKTIGLSLAVPPGRPRDYRIYYARRSMGIEFHVAILPESIRSPRKTSVQILLCRHDPAWGIRDMARRYDAFFPDYSTRRMLGRGTALIGATPAGVDTARGTERLGVRPSSLCGSQVVSFPPGKDALDAARQRGLANFLSLSPFLQVSYHGIYPETHAHAEALITRLEDPRLKVGPFWEPIRKATDAARKALVRSDSGRPFIPGFRESALDWREGKAREILFLLDLRSSLAETAAPEKPVPSVGRTFLNSVRDALLAEPLLAGLCVQNIEQVAGCLDYSPANQSEAEGTLTYDREQKRPTLVYGFALAQFLAELRQEIRSTQDPAQARYLWLHDVGLGQAAVACLLPLADMITFAAPASHDKGTGPAYDWVRTAAGEKPLLAQADLKRAGGTPAEGQADPLTAWLQWHTFYGIPVTLESLEQSDAIETRLAAAGADLRRHLEITDALRAAGWRALTHGKTATPSIWLERFGDYGKGNLHFTALNTGTEAADAEVQLDPTGLGFPSEEPVQIASLDPKGEVRTSADAERVTFRTRIEPGNCLVVKVGR